MKIGTILLSTKSGGNPLLHDKRLHYCFLFQTQREWAEGDAQSRITDKYNSRKRDVKMVVNILINNKELFTVNTQCINYAKIYARVEEETVS